MKPESLLARLVLFITLLLMAVWAAVALACWIESRNYMCQFS